jgi:hypothetical protein
MVTDGSSSSIGAVQEVGSEGNMVGKAGCRTPPSLRAAYDEKTPEY